MKLPLLACILLLELGVESRAQGEATRRPVPVEYQAECTLTPESVERLLIEVLVQDKRAAVDAQLVEHEVEHGWAVGLSSHDFIDKAQAVPCPEPVLLRMAQFRNPGGEVTVRSLHMYFATALQRAGRLDQALSMLDAARVEPAKESDNGLPMLLERESALAEISAKLCAREGRSERALEYAKRWNSTPLCSNCIRFEESITQSFRLRMFTELGRFDEAVEIALPLAFDSWSQPDACLIATWLDVEFGRHAHPDLASALEAIQHEDREHAFTRYFYGYGMRLWELRHASREEQLAHLGELAVLDEVFAMSLVSGLDNRNVEGQLAAFDLINGKLRDRTLVELLASTGNPCLLGPIERAQEPSGGRFDGLRHAWDEAHRRWVALSQKR